MCFNIQDGKACIDFMSKRISHFLNEQGTGYQYLKLIEFLKIEACQLKEHPNISNFTKFESYWFDWLEPPIHT